MYILSPLPLGQCGHLPHPHPCGVGCIPLPGLHLPLRCATVRLKLLFIPSKYHREMPFTKPIRLWKLNVYTTTQLVLVAGLWVVKLTPVAMFYPVLVILLIPIHRFIQRFIFTKSEVHLVSTAPHKPDAERNDVYIHTSIHCHPIPFASKPPHLPSHITPPLPPSLPSATPHSLPSLPLLSWTKRTLMSQIIKWMGMSTTIYMCRTS